MEKALRTFPLGSPGEPDDVTPQYLHDLLAGATDDNLWTSITDFVNILLAADLPTEINGIIYSGRLMAL